MKNVLESKSNDNFLIIDAMNLLGLSGLSWYRAKTKSTMT